MIDQLFDDDNIELEYVDDEDEFIDEIDFDLDDDIYDEGYDHYENLADGMTEEDIMEIADITIREFNEDKSSREDWDTITAEGLDQLGLTGGTDMENLPFEGACNVQHPIILESVISYQSKTSKELLPPRGPVKTKVLGRKTRENELRANRVQKYMNYQFTELMPEYAKNTHNMLFFLPLVGNGFKKKYYCPIKDRIVDEHVFPTDIYVNSMASSIEDADRVTEVIRKSEVQMRKSFEAGQYIGDIKDIGEPTSPQLSQLEESLREAVGISTQLDSCYTLIEQVRYLSIDEEYMELDDDQPLRPYVVVVHPDSQMVLSVRRAWASYDETFKKCDYITHFAFVPGGSFYAFGFVHLLGNLQKTLTATVRSLMDAGQFANLRAGYKKKNVRIMGGDEPLAAGEIRDAQYSGEKLSDAFHMLDFKEPSVVLKDMYTLLSSETRTFADSTQQVVAEATNYGPVGTTMALFENAAKFMAAVHMRAHASQKHELSVVMKYNFEFLPDVDDVSIVEDILEVNRSDYDPQFVQVIPVSDPNDPSQAQRVAKAQVILTEALRAPEKHNLDEVYKDFYNVVDVEDAERYLKIAKTPEPQGPLEDIMDVINGESIKAFKGQDHQSHVAFKMAWLQDPTQGGSHTLTQFQPLIVANIREHQLLEYATKLEMIQAQEQLSQEQAAQRLAQMAQAEQQVKEGGAPAQMIAQAEMMDAQTNAKKEARQTRDADRKFGLDLMKTGMQIEKEKTKAEQADREFERKNIQMGVDALKEGLREDNKKDGAS